MNEIWKDISGYESQYQISSLKRVKTKKDGKIRTPNSKGVISLGTHPFKIESLMLRNFPDIYIQEFIELTTLQGEVWKDIEGYEGTYQVSNLGRVKRMPCVSMDTQSITRFRRGSTETFTRRHVDLGGILKPVKIGIPSRKGEYRLGVVLCKNNKQSPHQISRLVAKAFIPNPLGLPEVNHKNRDFTNNNLDNLEWVDKRDNIEHATLDHDILIELYNLAHNNNVTPSAMLHELIVSYKKRKREDTIVSSLLR